LIKFKKDESAGKFIAERLANKGGKKKGKKRRLGGVQLKYT